MTLLLSSSATGHYFDNLKEAERQAYLMASNVLAGLPAHFESYQPSHAVRPPPAIGG
jgi:hypothetical protein